MRMKSLILIFIALGCGLVASIGISQVMDLSGGGSGMEMEQILVALTDIDIGAKLGAENVKLEDWPKAKVPDGAVRLLDDVKDQYANARFFKGEPIHVSKITGQLGNFTLKIQEGYRVMPVKVDEDTVMKGIAPGDRVDVMVFLRRNGQEINVTGAFTLLKNVRVFAVNTSTERASDAKGETANFRTVSLLVKPDHARELAVASQMGKILLTLRRPDEQDLDAGEEVTPIEEILKGGSDVASDTPPSPPAAPDAGFLGFVKGIGAGIAASSPPDAAAPPQPAAPVWSLLLMTPHGTQQYDWMNEKDLPIQTTRSGEGTSTPPTPATPVSKHSDHQGATSSSEGQNAEDAAGADGQPHKK